MAASVEELVFDLSLDSLSHQRDALKDVTLMPAIYLASAAGETRLLIEGPRLYSELSSAGASLDETYMALADEIDAVRRENRLVVDRTLRTLRLGFAALVAEVILLLAALAVH